MSGAQMRRQLTPAILLVAIVFAAFLLAMSPVGTSALSPVGTAAPGSAATPALNTAGRTVAGAVQARTLTAEDLGLEVSVSDPQLSPDGRSVVVVTSRPDYQENRFDRQLVLVDVASGLFERRSPHPPAPVDGRSDSLRSQADLGPRPPSDRLARVAGQTH